jgi:hypothetical protein
LVREVSTTQVGHTGSGRCVTLREIQDWAFTEDHKQLLCPGCVEKKLDEDRLYLVDGRVRDKQGFPVFEPDTDLALQLAYMDELEDLEPLSRAWPRRPLLRPYRPVPTPEEPWRCDSCSLPILVSTAPL